MQAIVNWKDFGRLTDQKSPRNKDYSEHTSETSFYIVITKNKIYFLEGFRRKSVCSLNILVNSIFESNSGIPSQK